MTIVSGAPAARLGWGTGDSGKTLPPGASCDENGRSCREQTRAVAFCTECGQANVDGARCCTGWVRRCSWASSWRPILRWQAIHALAEDGSETVDGTSVTNLLLRVMSCARRSSTSIVSIDAHAHAHPRRRPWRIRDPHYSSPDALRRSAIVVVLADFARPDETVGDQSAQNDIQLRLRRRPEVPDAIIGELLQVIAGDRAAPHVAEHRKHREFGNSALRHTAERSIRTEASGQRC
jgi:hypothetical protein